MELEDKSRLVGLINDETMEWFVWRESWWMGLVPVRGESDHLYLW